MKKETETIETIETDVMPDEDPSSSLKEMVTTTHMSKERYDSASSSIDKAASLFAAYETWVGSHTGLARNVETALYVVPQLIPKRAMEPEVAAQVGYSFVGLLHLYHDYVLWKKGTNHEVEQSMAGQKLTRLIRVPLSLISHVQVSAEVVARKFGSDAGKRRLIVWVEVIKGMLLLVLLAHRRRAMLIRGGKYKGVESLPQMSPFARFGKAKRPGARTGKTFGKATASEPSAPAEKGVDEAPNKITFEAATIELAEGSREDLLLAGEVCHILRPMVYALLRRRRPQSSWTPVLVSLLVELSGLALSAAAAKPVEREKSVCTDKAKDEIAARKMALLFYLLRDPVFATITKPAVGKAAHVMDYVPGIGKLFRFGTSAVLDYYHQFYFYTSAS
uniref:Peroxisomal membrane protein PEX16 n=1 Tax=Peronospora matthiolae TaxID=2874970 RepID=A0AAV1TPD4_9STRA